MNKIMCGLSVGLVAGAVLLSSCSTNLGPETLPSTTPATETTVETEPTETTPPEIPEHTEPYSQAIITGSIVNSYGALSINGNDLTNSEGQSVVLKGMSSYGLQECGDFFTYDVIKTLAEDWGCDILRIAITGDKDSEDSYLKDPDKYFDTVCKIVDMCEIQGIYVIVDWNIAYDEEYDEHLETAVDFFKRISVIYASSPNIIYEINNDPITPYEDLESSEEWEDKIIPFVTDVIDAIRENSSDSVIIVGTPKRSIDVDVAAESPLDYSNIAYSCHILSGTHTDSHREKIESALDEDVCVFVTEWSLANEFGGGGIHIAETTKWVEFLDENAISWCNYAIGSASTDDTNALNLDDERYTDAQKTSGHWPAGLISESGSFARAQFLTMTEETSETTETTETTEETEETEEPED